MAYDRIFLIVFGLFFSACIPVREIMWYEAYVTFPNQTTEFQIYRHPFSMVLLYSSETRYIAEIPWENPYQPIIQASLILAVIFIVFAFFSTIGKHLWLDTLLATISLLFAGIGFGLWQNQIVTEGFIPFYNLTLVYTGDVTRCSRRRCYNEKDYDIIPTNYSQNVVQLPIKSYYNDAGWIVWLTGLSILGFIVFCLVVVLLVDCRDVKFKEEEGLIENKKEQDIILT